MKKILVALSAVIIGMFVFVGVPTVKANIQKSVENSVVINQVSDDNSDLATPNFDGDKNKKKSKKKSSSCSPSSCKSATPACSSSSSSTSTSGEKKCCSSSSSSSSSAPAKSCCAPKK